MAISGSYPLVHSNTTSSDFTSAPSARRDPSAARRPKAPPRRSAAGSAAPTAARRCRREGRGRGGPGAEGKAMGKP